MGKTIITVGVSVTKMVTNPVNVIQDSMINSIIANKNLATSLSLDLRNSFTSSVRNYFKYGQEHSLLPSSLNTNSTTTLDAVQEQEIINIVTAIAGKPITIRDIKFSKVDYLFLANEWLNNQPQSFWDNLSTTRKVNIHQIVPNYTYYNNNTGFLQVRLLDISKFFGSSFSFNTTNNKYFTVTTNIPYILPNTKYFHVRYSINNEIPTKQHFFNYKKGTGTYPTLDAQIAKVLGDRLIPIAPVRVNKVNVIDMKNTEASLYSNTKEALNKLNIDLQDFTNKLVDPNNNSSLDNVEQVFIMFAMDLNSKETISLKYLYEAFKIYYGLQDPKQADWVTAFNSLNSLGRLNFVSVNSTNFRSLITYNFITLQVKTGLITDTQPAIDPLVTVPYDPTIDATSVAGEVSVEVVLGTQAFLGSYDDQANTSYIIYRKQLTSTVNGDTTNTFSELVVHGIFIEYGVYKGGVDQLPKSFYRDLSTMSDGGLLFPVSFDIVDLFNGANETAIYYESLRTVVYAVQIQHLGFFQSGLFAALITIVIVVISIITNTEAFTGSLLHIVEQVVKAVVINAIIGFAFIQVLKLVVNVIGLKASFVLAAIIAIADIYLGNVDGLFKLLDVQVSLESVAFSFLNAINVVIKDDFLTLIQSSKDFLTTLKEKQEELDKANALLDNAAQIELYNIIDTPRVNFNESPENFYNRTVHNMNPGVKTLDVIGNYVNLSLQLPKPIST